MSAPGPTPLRLALLLQGAPALLGLAALVGVLLTGAAPDPAVYRAGGDAAFGAGDWSTAALCYQRAGTVAALSPERLDRLARALDASGRRAGARVLMERLANAGHPGAHLWVARRLLVGAPSRAATVRGRYHLEQVVKGRPDDWQARAMLAALHLSAGQHRAAEAQLTAVVAARPGLQLTLAQLYQAWIRALPVDQRERAADLAGRLRHHAREAVRHLGPRYYEDETDAELLHALITAHTLAREHDRALTLVDRGEARRPDPAWARLRARIHLDASRTEAARVDGSPWRAVEQLLQAFEHDPGDAEINHALEAAGAARAPTARRVLRALRARLTGGPGDVPVQMVLGNIALTRGDHPRAVGAFRAARRHQPTHPAVVNNLAWALAHLQPPRLTEALALIDGLPTPARRAARVRDTRALILFGLKRWEAALPELMAALRAAPREARLHRMLATVYEKLDLPRVAESHREATEHDG